ncbi:hypothetical protein, partial [Plasmodium yoelii yoelii]
ILPIYFIHIYMNIIINQLKHCLL